MAFKTIPQEEPKTYVLEPKEDNILFGRGNGPTNHEGNLKFLDEINARKTEYNATSNRATKLSIARTILSVKHEGRLTGTIICYNFHIFHTVFQY